jgi:hypothetical protein
MSCGAERVKLLEGNEMSFEKHVRSNLDSLPENQPDVAPIESGIGGFVLER